MTKLKKTNKRKSPKLVFGVATLLCNKMFLYDEVYNQTDFECLLQEDNSTLTVIKAKVCLLKLQDADLQRDITQLNTTNAQYQTY